MAKRKTAKDIFETECWAKEIVTDKYQVLAQLFGSCGLYSLRHFIKKVLQAAISEGIYKSKSPADVLLFMRLIHSLIKVTDVLKAKKASDIIVDPADILNKKYFTCNRHSPDEWTDFPRFLSKKEYRNPYSVFRKFFKHMPINEWLNLWADIVETALSKGDLSLGINEITVYTHLAKLVEAAHLIDVREVIHVDGHLKRR